MNTLPVTHISCLYTVLDVLDIIQSLYSPSVEGSLVKSVGTKFKYYPHWCLNSPLPRACSLSGPQFKPILSLWTLLGYCFWEKKKDHLVPLNASRGGRREGSPCSTHQTVPWLWHLVRTPREWRSQGQLSSAWRLQAHAWLFTKVYSNH